MFKNTISIEVEIMESIAFEDVDEIGEDQSYDYIGGWFPVYVEMVEEKKEVNNLIKGMNINKNSKILATRHSYDFKIGDLVRLYGRDRYKVSAVKLTIDPKYANVIRMFPQARDQYTWKVIILG